MNIRKPRLSLTKKGLKLTKPSARIGGKTGINISSSGVSASHRTKHGTISTKRGCSIPCLPHTLIILAAPLILYLLFASPTNRRIIPTWLLAGD